MGKFGREVAIIGVGMHPWGKFPDKDFVDLGYVAVKNALKDAGVEWKDIQSMVSGCWVWGGTNGMNAGPRLAATLGETGIPILNIFNMCATSNGTLREACLQVASGAYDTTMAVGLDMSPKGFFAMMGKEDPSRYNCIDTDYMRWKMVGITNPAYWALDMRKRMEKYGTTKETLAMCKVAASKHGALNPHAIYKHQYTVDEILNSPMVTDPLTLYMISPTRDGAAAIIVTTLEKARQYTTKPIIVAGVGMGSSLYGDPTARLGLVYAPQETPGSTFISESVMAAQEAYKMSGIGPEDLDFAEYPDNSPWHYLQYMESLGFCGEGEADRMLNDGETMIGGKIPVCPSGGASSFGEVICAQGLAAVCEIVWQLKGEAGARQVKGAKAALAQTYGQLGNSAAAILKI